jgi:hypothetical protein
MNVDPTPPHRDPRDDMAWGAARQPAQDTTVGVRLERDALGEVAVPADRPWGAQTQRALEHFAISTERWPREFIVALARVKRAAARAHRAGGTLHNATLAVPVVVPGMHRLLVTVEPGAIALTLDERLLRLEGSVTFLLQEIAERDPGISPECWATKNAVSNLLREFEIAAALRVSA